jgi:hypothetical protein
MTLKQEKQYKFYKIQIKKGQAVNKSQEMPLGILSNLASYLPLSMGLLTFSISVPISSKITNNS